MRSNNWHPKVIEKYLEKYYKNSESRDTGRVYLRNFFVTMKQEPDEFIKRKPEFITKKLWEYAKLIENRAPKTQNSMLSFIKKFLLRSRVKIDAVEFDDIKRRNNLLRIRPIVKKKTPTPYDLKKILSYATGIKPRALFVFCASTGMRIDEALSITWDDIDLEARQVDIRDEVGKFDIPRYTFFTTEAKELLELWKPEREKALQSMYKKSAFLRGKLKKQGLDLVREQRNQGKFGKGKDCGHYWKVYKNGKELTKEEIIALDRRVFPFDYVNANKMWINLLEKAGTPYNEIDKNPKLKDRKYGYNIHSLRRFFYTQLSTDRANDEFVNFMGGHTSLLDASYKEYLENEVMRRKIKDEYDTHQGCLMVFQSAPDLSNIKSDMEAMAEEIQKLKAEVIEQRVTNLELKEKINGKK